MLVVTGIHRIEAPLGDRIICVYLLVGDQRIMLVDSGLDSTPRDFILPYLSSVCGERRLIDYVVTTHADFDHMGGNASIRELFPQASFMAHTFDRSWIENIDLLLQENYGQFDADHGTLPDPQTNAWIRTQARGTPIQLELLGDHDVQLSAEWSVKIIHTPGHTRGHLSVVDPRSNAIIVADAVLSDGLYARDGTIAFPPTYRFLDDYLQTVQRLSRLGPTTLLTSHYPVMRDKQVRAFLEKTRVFTQRLQEELLRLLGSSSEAMSTLQLAEKLSPLLGSWPSSASEFLLFPLLGHLESLEQAGAVTKSRISGVLVYRLRNQ
jgi:glyoxylase-like metal-dependent hydrolase (beta-lactamase superfamily II)